MAKTGWRLAGKQGTGSNSGTSGGGLGGAKRMYSTSSHVGTSGNVVWRLNGWKVQMKFSFYVFIKNLKDDMYGNVPKLKRSALFVSDRGDVGINYTYTPKFLVLFFAHFLSDLRRRGELYYKSIT